ncbi:MAG: hypothetical protein K2X45_03745 [Phreatobacter sp.]|nr:hypothetical protein [Phreatobacter sp.]
MNPSAFRSRPIRARLVTLATIGLLAAPAASSAQAQSVCPEGRTREGRCVNATLAAGQRLAAIVLGQTRLSLSIMPVLPSRDHGTTDPTLRNHVGREVSVIHP